jgi:hypothetical protein
MTTFIAIIIVIVVIAVLAGNSKKKTQLTTTTNPTSGNSSNADSQQVFKGDYLPQNIQRTGLQVLETIHIIGASKAVDTIKGRYDFLLQIIGTLQKGQSNSRYLSDIQKSIDTYKSMYYDRVPQDYELALLLKPVDFDLTDFYCKSLVAAFKRSFEEHSEEIKLLKREDAKIRRKEKIKEIIRFTKDELISKCSSAASFVAVMTELENIESTMPTDSSTSSSPLVIESKSIQPTADITSIKPKQSARKETEFVLNQGATFELTLLGADDALGRQIQNILLDDKIWDDKKKQQIVALFAEYNLKVKEVEAYKKKYGKVYFDKLEMLKNASAEWQAAGELDKEDLLEDYREIAIKEIYEQANCDLVSLFEKEPADITVDDALIKEYGFENIQTYLRFADNLDKVRIIPNDNYNRQKFEKLVELGLSIRGSSIPLEEILSTLTLKDLNEIANNPEKQFKRKNQAIEFILAIPNIEEKIVSKISLRELFKLKPLPEKFASVNLQEFSNAWSYAYEVVGLLVDTYLNANYSAQTLKDKEYVKEYKVEYWGNEENMCPCAKELINKKYPKARPPKIPYHIGCNCSLRQEYNFK